MRYFPHRHNKSDTSDCVNPRCPLNRRVPNLLHSSHSESSEKKLADRRDILHSRLRKVPCIFLGESKGEHRQCIGCGQNNNTSEVYQCLKHGECSVEREVEGPEKRGRTLWCTRCHDYYPIGFDRLPVNSVEEPQSSKSIEISSVEESSSPPRKILRWAYGITTVPSRREDIFPRTLESLIRAGFDHPRLFIDGCNPEIEKWYREKFALPITSRNPLIRTFGNWVMALWELYLREPDQDRYALFQDDFVTVKNLRVYLDQIEYPRNGYINLYTFPENARLAHKKEVKSGLFEANQRGRGAVALIFSREAVQVLLSSAHMVDRPTNPHRGWRAIDGGIVDSFRKAGWKEFCHLPSLTQHIGLKSSMGNGPQPESDTFPGEEFNALSLLKQGIAS